MKMSKEYTLVLIAGLFLLAYLLDVLVDPLTVDLITPYHFLNPTYLLRYPFTTASILIKSLALFISPLWLMSFFSKNYYPKGGTLLVLASLMQLYAIQEVATNTQIIPIEWSLSLSIAGALLLLPSTIFILRGIVDATAKKLKPQTKEIWPEENDNDA